jgi:hypothetical protein
MDQRELNLVRSNDAEMALSSLGDDDRRQVSDLLEILRHGRDDARVRFHSVAVATMPYHFVWYAGEWLIFFRESGDDVVVVSIHRKDALNKFKAASQAIG